MDYDWLQFNYTAVAIGEALMKSSIINEIASLLAYDISYTFLEPSEIVNISHTFLIRKTY